MSRHDLTRASDVALLAVVRASLSFDDPAELAPITRRCLKAFAQELIDDLGEDFQELAALRAECRVKTRAEYDREIGDAIRSGAVPAWGAISALVEASRSAPEDAP
jgi:hypothetical protein